MKLENLLKSGIKTNKINLLVRGLVHPEPSRKIKNIVEQGKKVYSKMYKIQ